MSTAPGRPTMTFLQREVGGTQPAPERPAPETPAATVPATEAQPEGTAETDPRAIAERVYRLMRDEIEIERIRRGW